MLKMLIGSLIFVQLFTLGACGKKKKSKNNGPSNPSGLVTPPANPPAIDDEGEDEDEVPEFSSRDLQAQVQKIFETYCVACHNPVDAQGDFDITNLNEISANSEKIAEYIASGEMPRKGTMSEADLKTIAEWKQAGFPIVNIKIEFEIQNDPEEEFPEEELPEDDKCDEKPKKKKCFFGKCFSHDHDHDDCDKYNCK